MELTSQVIISAQLEDTLIKLEALIENEQIIEIYSQGFAAKFMQGREDEVCHPQVKRIAGDKQSFTLTEAKTVVEKAYLSSERKTVIILIADTFSTVVQNALLKVVEEPPENKIFIFLTQSKSAILPTIQSRLPIKVLSEKSEKESFGLDLDQLSLATVYAFSQSHKRTDSKSMKTLLERIAKESIGSGLYDLDEKTLTLFSTAYKALDVGSPSQFVLNTVLLKLLARKKR